MSSVDELVVRARLLLTAAAVGLAVGGVGVAILATLRTLDFASTQVFAVGALILGFGVLGWSGSVLAGGGIESLQRYLETDTDWTEVDSRRAMGRLSGFGAGAMVGVALVTTVLAGLR